jgi:hypothetical protein
MDLDGLQPNDQDAIHRPATRNFSCKRTVQNKHPTVTSETAAATSALSQAIAGKYGASLSQQ